VAAAARKQREIFAAMTPEEKLVWSFRLRSQAWELRAAFERQQHPQWTEAQVQDHVRRVFLYART
jgi:hypothetical protein